MIKHKYIVLDDDPTGIQTVHDVLVLINYDYNLLCEAFKDPREMFYISTNSRAFSEQETIKYHVKLIQMICDIARELNIDFTIISRGDSSLRGHFPLEGEVIKKVLNDNGYSIDGEIICPYLDGIRKTVDDVHYVINNGIEIPVGESEFAKDKTFGFKSSNLKDYVEEKTKGSYKACDCISIGLDDEFIVDKLNSVTNFNKVIVNCVSMNDLKKFVDAYKQTNKKFLFRCAASLVKELGNIKDIPYLDSKKCISYGSGGLILAGSHVKNTSDQLAYLRQHDSNVDYVEFNQHEVLNNNLHNEAIRCAKLIDEKLRQNKTVLLATRRDRVDFPGDDKEKQLEMAVSISKELTGILSLLKVRPSFLISKGGITSYDCLSIDLDVKKALALGQIEKNVGVIRILDDSKFKDMPVVIFPGNVGSVDTLYKITERLKGMEKKVFGYPKFDEKGEMILTTYDNEYSDMLMDIRVYKLNKDETLSFTSSDEEVAVLLLNGELEMDVDGVKENVARRSVFLDGPYAGHVSKNKTIVVKANSETEILVQKTKNGNDFESKLYKPSDAPFNYSNKGKYNNTAARRVNTIFDHDINPLSNMVLGEVLNDSGNWSGYLPHRHPQPECYYFLFDHEEGFGASYVGDEVFKSTNRSFSAIPGGKLHPQVCAPGYQMYTCWMIRHLDGNPWLQTDRCEDDAYVWLKEAEFDPETNSFKK